MQEPTNQPLALTNPATPAARTALALPTMVQGMDQSMAGNGASPPPTFGTLVQALRRRWKLATGLAIVGALAGVMVVMTLFPAMFTTSSRVQVSMNPDVKYFTPTTNEGPDFITYRASLAAYIKSPMVINAALKQVKDLPSIREQNSAVDWLENALKTDFLLAPEIMRLTLSGDRPDDVAKIVNAVTDAFIKEMDNKEKARRQVRLDELKENHRYTLETLNQKRRTYYERIKTGGLDDPATHLQLYGAALSDLAAAKKAVLDKRLEKISSEEEIRSLQGSLKNLDRFPITDLQIDEVLKPYPAYQQLLLNQLEVEKSIFLHSIAVKDPDNDPQMAVYQEKRKDLEKQKAELRKQFRPELEKVIRSNARDKMQQQMYILQEKLNGLDKQQLVLAGEIERREKEVSRLKNNPLPLDVLALRDDISSMETTVSKLKDMITSLQAEPGLLGSRVTLLQRAEPPSARDTSKQMKMAGLAGIGMIGLCLFGVSWWEFRARRISAADEVVQSLRMSLVGTLPALPQNARQPVPGNSAADLAWQGRLNEAVDSIRTLLLHAARTESLQVVMVTSALQGEGKTSLASQLAASLARAWRKTLLVDGDLRKPGVHALFGLPVEPGLSEVLRGEVQASETVKPTPLSRLWMMPAGHWDSHAVQALAQDGVRTMFSQLKEHYDFIIVDSAPVLPVADSLLLGQNVDAVIFSVLRDVSRLPTLQSAQQRLNNLGIRTLGAVVLGDNHTGHHLHASA
jgi:capsular exopolysaccharide synthesis family protein